MKSTPFHAIRRVPNGIKVGDTLKFAEDDIGEVTKITSVEFTDKETFKIIGWCKSVQEDKPK